MKIRIATLFLAVVCILATRWQVISSAWSINSAYIFLTRAIEKPDESAAARFNDWVIKSKSSTRERDASTYGLAMFLAHPASTLSEDWLQRWNKVGCHLTTDLMRNEFIEQEVVASVTPKNLLAMLDCLDDQTSAQWLIFAAEERPKDAMIYVGEIERRRLVSGLSQADRIRLATVYGDLVNQLRVSGSSNEQVMVLVNKSLALDPQSELALIVKAILLDQSGHTLDGIALLDQVTVLYPKSTYAWEWLAALRINNSDFEGAERAARTSIVSIPSDRGSWGKYLLAFALLRQKRCAEALSYAQISVRTYPEYPKFLLTLGDVYWCLGDRAQASSVYQQLEALHPDYAPYVHERIQPTK